MSQYQNRVYEAYEADQFFERCQEELSNLHLPGDLRESKRDLYNLICKHVVLAPASSVLEIGCFVGDLLASLNKNYSCSVFGVEPSHKAVQFASEKFGIKIQKCSFQSSTYFNNFSDYESCFDLIIAEDVLSWMPRNSLLLSLGIIDHILKPGGFLLLRDFAPPFSFAYQNHHVKQEKVYNFKQGNGHKSFFLNSGMYITIQDNITNTLDFQKITTSRMDSSIWNLCIMQKLSSPLHPVLDF